MMKRSKYVCWTRMGAYAGHSLECIIKYKEAERESECKKPECEKPSGLFYWGFAENIGRSRLDCLKDMAKKKTPIQVVFSKTKTENGEPLDLNGKTRVWLQHLDSKGEPIALHEGVLLTSGVSIDRYFALVCESNDSLIESWLRCIKPPFDLTKFRRCGGEEIGGRLPNTVLLQRDSRGSRHQRWMDGYKIDMEASLTGDYVIELTAEKCEYRDVKTSTVLGWDGKDWLKFVRDIKGIKA